MTTFREDFKAMKLRHPEWGRRVDEAENKMLRELFDEITRVGKRVVEMERDDESN